MTIDPSTLEEYRSGKVALGFPRSGAVAAAIRSQQPIVVPVETDCAHIPAGWMAVDGDRGEKRQIISA